MPKPICAIGHRDTDLAPLLGSNVDEELWMKGDLPLRRDTDGAGVVSVYTYLGAEPDTARGPPSSMNTQCNLRQAASSLSVFLTSISPTIQFVSSIKFLQGQWGITPLPTEEILREPQERHIMV